MGQQAKEVKANKARRKITLKFIVVVVVVVVIVVVVFVNFDL